MERRLRVIPLLLLPIATNLLAADSSPTESSVRAAENRWSEAFISGDTATLESLLDPDYVSTGATGKPRTKAEIIALASAYAKAHPGQHGQPLAATSTIRVIGNAAVVQHHNPTDT